MIGAVIRRRGEPLAAETFYEATNGARAVVTESANAEVVTVEQGPARFDPKNLRAEVLQAFRDAQRRCT